MELRPLRYFTAVADAGHMTRAARQLGIQQPPLSQQIRALEQRLGVALFTRHPKGVALTAAGRQFLAEARGILDGVAAMEQRMASVARGLRGVLAAGFTSSTAAHAFAPCVLRACRREHPDIDLQISENNAAELTEAVAAGQVHCAFLRVPVARPAGVAFEELQREPVVLALPIDHPLAVRYGADHTVPWSALQDQPLILVRRPRAPGLYANLLNLVAAGAGISVVPASMHGAHPRSVAYRRLPSDPGLEAPLTIAFRADDDPTVKRTFLALARRLAAEDGQRACAGPESPMG